MCCLPTLTTASRLAAQAQAAGRPMTEPRSPNSPAYLDTRPVKGAYEKCENQLASFERTVAWLGEYPQAAPR